MLIALPALPAAADSWKDESGHGHHRGGGKQVYYDGPCRIEREWKRNGKYKEETECGGYAYGPTYYVYPAYPIDGYPPPPPPVVMVPSGPSISVTIPLDRR